MSSILQVKEVTKRYSNHLALNNVSIDVSSKSVFGLLGPNGAGKTSLIRIINQITAPDKGEVTRRKLAEEAAAAKANLSESAMELKDRVLDSMAYDPETLETRIEDLLSNVSYKAEDVIVALEKKLAELKNKNKKLQKTS